jgi:hypothetical protein
VRAARLVVLSLPVELRDTGGALLLAAAPLSLPIPPDLFLPGCASSLIVELLVFAPVRGSNVRSSAFGLRPPPPGFALGGLVLVLGSGVRSSVFDLRALTSVFIPGVPAPVLGPRGLGLAGPLRAMQSPLTLGLRLLPVAVRSVGHA